MKVLLFLPSTLLRCFYKPGFFCKISQTSLPWQKRTEEVSQVSCSKEVSLIFADITEEKVTSRKIGHKISARVPCNFTAKFSSLSLRKEGWTDRLHANKNLCMCKSGHRPRHESLIFIFTLAGNSNLNTQRVFREWPRLAWRAQVGLRVLIRAQSGRQVFIFHMCPALNPDQDMVINFDFLRASGPRSKTLCMSKSEPRPGHADQFCFRWAPGPRSKTLCMSKSEPRPGHANEFWFSPGARAPLKNPLRVQV